MNGLRSNSPRHSDTSSLDALNRTIEGLEARIEGLMNQPAREQRHKADLDQSQRPDPLHEIRQRQRALDAGWERPTQPPVRAERPGARNVSPERPERDYRASTAATTPPSRVRPASPQHSTPASRPEPRPAAPQGDLAMRDIAQALVNLRQELKQDLSEGVAREVQGLRSEIREIKSFAEDRRFAGDIREDISRLAASIDQLGSRTSQDDAYDLSNEFEDLRLLMEQVAREDSMQRMEGRWTNVEDSLRGFDAASLQDEIVSLAYRLDDIKGQLGAMSDSPAVLVLEEKLIAIATAMEQLGQHMQPNDKKITEQFSGLDQRLDEISRAIAAASTRTSSAAMDNSFAQRLESRLTGLASQIDELNSSTAARIDPADELTARIDALTGRIEDLASERNAANLDERLDQLSLLMERSQRPTSQPELTGFLTDISRKIDALDQGAVNDGLAERLDLLSRRIEDLDYRHSQPQPAPAFNDTAFLRIEERLGNIALRLEETATAVPSDNSALRNLEDQIANLSSLISQPSYQEAPAMPPELDVRMAAIEDYMASSDEYIIEAARQAAEAVIEAYSRKGLGATNASPDMAMMTELASDLRNLENLSRSTEERTHRTFEALHETLVQIAGRLDSMDSRSAPAEPVYREKSQTRRVETPAVAAVVAPAPESLFAYAGDEAGDQWSGSKSVLMPPAIFPDEGLFSPEPPVTSFKSDDVVHDTASDQIVPPAAAKPVKAEKKSLIAGLTRRFKSGAAKTIEEPARTQVSPAPSLDPIDVLPTNQENDLLEPGSGAPDIKKILERVRASQAAPRNTTNDTDNRADYIAAARRAAQAAAQETQPEKGTATRKAKLADTDAKSSAFARYRRPLLLGIGAILLAMMAMPLVKTLVSGEPVPPQAIEHTEAEQSQAQPPVQTPQVTEQAASQPVTIPSDLLIEEDGVASESMETAAGTQEQKIDPRTIGGANLPEEPSLAAPAPASNADIAAPVIPVETIAVPAAVQPASLAEAASKGDRLALFEIGARYTEGRGVTADLAEAAKWYRLSADKGLAPAQYRLANMYEKGTGVPRDLAQAKTYYGMAANQGNAGAMHNLAVLLASDSAGQPDYATAGSWFQKASELGVRDSQFNLAILYARGSGVKQDIEESYKWFSIAARDGDTDAGQKRDEVANAMRPEQLESARAKVTAWKVTPLSDDANSINLPDEWTAQGGVKTSSVDMSKAISNIQAILNNNGFDAGAPDGKLGKNTVTAIKDFQKSIGHDADGRITDELVTALLARNK